MPPRDPTKTQLDFPILTADLIDQLNLTGTVGLLDFLAEVRPVFLIGSRGITFGSQLPDFGSAEVFDGTGSNPAANTVIATTGALPAGTYDIACNIASSGTGTAGQFWALQHRNAADAATLATLLSLPLNGTQHSREAALPPIGYVLALNERLRVVTPATAPAAQITTSIFAALRPTP